METFFASSLARQILVPLMILLSGGFMAVAWLGHLRFKNASFLVALAASWAIVLPEYLLNVVATRYGHPVYTGAQMGMIHLASGVICVTLVSRFALGETFRGHQSLGVGLLLAGLVLLLWKPGA